MDIPIIGPLIRWLQATFFSKHLQIVILGLQSAGKTSLVNVISSGQFSEEMVPTVGFNMRKIQTGNVQIKMWDIGYVLAMGLGRRQGRLSLTSVLFPAVVNRGFAPCGNATAEECQQSSLSLILPSLVPRAAQAAARTTVARHHKIRIQLLRQPIRRPTVPHVQQH